MNSNHPPDTNTPPDAPPAGQSARDDLVIDDWIAECNYDLDLARARTVGDLRREIERWFNRVPLSAQFCPAVFAARDGRLYTADVGVVVRPATSDEVREAVERAKEDEGDMLDDRIEELHEYLERVTA